MGTPDVYPAVAHTEWSSGTAGLANGPKDRIADTQFYNSREVLLGTVSRILRQAGIDRDTWEKLR